MIDKSCAILNEISIKASHKCVAQHESCSLSSIIVSISINFSFQYKYQDQDQEKKNQEDEDQEEARVSEGVVG